MRYIYLLTALIFMGCSDKSTNVRKLPESEQKIEVVEVAKVQEIKKVTPKNVIPKNEILIPEKKVTKNIPSDVPNSCAMWSDGSNICNRVSTGKASCTTNSIENRMFSCLQWQ